MTIIRVIVHIIDSQIISTTYGSVSRMVQNLSDNNPPLIARYITKFQLGVPEVVEIINYEFWLVWQATTPHHRWR